MLGSSVSGARVYARRSGKSLSAGVRPEGTSELRALPAVHRAAGHATTVQLVPRTSTQFVTQRVTRSRTLRKRSLPCAASADDDVAKPEEDLATSAGPSAAQADVAASEADAGAGGLGVLQESVAKLRKTLPYIDAQSFVAPSVQLLTPFYNLEGADAYVDVMSHWRKAVPDSLDDYTYEVLSFIQPDPQSVIVRWKVKWQYSRNGPIALPTLLPTLRVASADEALRNSAASSSTVRDRDPGDLSWSGSWQGAEGEERREVQANDKSYGEALEALTIALERVVAEATATTDAIRQLKPASEDTTLEEEYRYRDRVEEVVVALLGPLEAQVAAVMAADRWCVDQVYSELFDKGDEGDAGDLDADSYARCRNEAVLRLGKAAGLLKRARAESLVPGGDEVGVLLRTVEEIVQAQESLGEVRKVLRQTYPTYATYAKVVTFGDQDVAKVTRAITAAKPETGNGLLADLEKALQEDFARDDGENCVFGSTKLQLDRSGRILVHRETFDLDPTVMTQNGQQVRKQDDPEAFQDALLFALYDFTCAHQPSDRNWVQWKYEMTKLVTLIILREDPAIADELSALTGTEEGQKQLESAVDIMWVLYTGGVVLSVVLAVGVVVALGAAALGSLGGLGPRALVDSVLQDPAASLGPLPWS